jgi:hypothetical protein
VLHTTRRKRWSMAWGWWQRQGGPRVRPFGTRVGSRARSETSLQWLSERNHAPCCCRAPGALASVRDAHEGSLLLVLLRSCNASVHARLVYCCGVLRAPSCEASRCAAGCSSSCGMASSRPAAGLIPVLALVVCQLGRHRCVCVQSIVHSFIRSLRQPPPSILMLPLPWAVASCRASRHCRA